MNTIIENVLALEAYLNRAKACGVSDTEARKILADNQRIASEQVYLDSEWALERSSRELVERAYERG